MRIVADDMLGDCRGVVRFQAHSIRTEIGLKIKLRKKIKSDAARAIAPLFSGDCRMQDRTVSETLGL
jgi:hypothetical protein